MAKQKLTSRHIELIKYWGAIGFTHQHISDLMDCTRGHITKILNSKRWSEVKIPTLTRAKELERRLYQDGKLDLYE